jgi:PKD repeat protein
MIVYTGNGANGEVLMSQSFGTGPTSTIPATTPTAVPGPAANFTGTPLSGTVPLNVTFTDLSTGSPNQWAWAFGDGNTSTLKNPLHTYSAAGTYSVTLTASNAGGNNSITKTGYITVTVPVSGTVTLNSPYKGGYIESGGVMQFRNTWPYASSITLNGVTINLNTGDTIKLVWGSNESGSMYSTSSALTVFSFNDILVYINNNYQGRGAVSSISVNAFDQFQSTVNLNMPAVPASSAAWTEFEINSNPVFPVGSSSTGVRLIGLNVPFNSNPGITSSNIYYVGGASAYITM